MMTEPVIFFEGQSNALGRDTTGDKTIIGDVMVWNNENDRSTMDLVNLGTRWQPLDFDDRPFVGGGNSMTAHHAMELSEAIGQRVYLILNARGNTSIGQWFSASVEKPMLTRGKAILALALAALDRTSFDAYARHQGEADNSVSNSGYYPGRHAAVLNSYTSAGYMSATTPVIIGEVAAKYTNINPVLNGIAAADPRCRIVPCKDFNLLSDGIHYAGDESARIGLVYAGLQQLLAG